MKKPGENEAPEGRSEAKRRAAPIGRAEVQAACDGLLLAGETINGDAVRARLGGRGSPNTIYPAIREYFRALPRRLHELVPPELLGVPAPIGEMLMRMWREAQQAADALAAQKMIPKLEEIEARGEALDHEEIELARREELLETRLAEMQQRLERTEAELAETKTRARDADEGRLKAIAERERTRAELVELQNAERAVRQELKSQAETHTAAVKSLREEHQAVVADAKREHSRALGAVQQQLASAEHSVRTLEGALGETRERAASLDRALAKRTAERDALAERHQSATRAHEALERERHALAAREAAAQRAASAHQDRVAELEDLARGRDTRIAALEAQVLALSGERDRAVAQSTALLDELPKWRARFEQREASS
jgi:colicin import membrane protein